MVTKEAKEEKEWLEQGQYASNLTPAQQNTVIKLVGKRCMIKCLIENIPTEVLWDTGAQVSIASHEWVTRNFPNIKVNPVEDLIENNLDLKAANGLPIPYKGFVEVRFQPLNSQNRQEVLLPLLVATDRLDHPIIGYNVIEELVKYPADSGCSTEQNDIMSSMAASFSTVKPNNIETLVEFMKSNQHSELCSVKTIKHDVLIPKGKTMSVTCRANTRSNKTSKLPVLFEPDPEQPWPTGLDINETLTNINGGVSSRVVIQVRNSTDHDIVLPKRTTL